MRPWNDVQMTSHVAFVPGIAIAAVQTPPLPELALLQSATLALSLAYHRNYERPGLLADCEGTSAKALFVYGTAQTLTNCPIDQTALWYSEGGCFVLTLACFLLTNFNKGWYERWHPWGLHVVPGVWAALVATGHSSLLPASALAALPWPSS